MSVTTRALAVPTGHPILKLTLLTVAAAPGWPAAADVAELAEIAVDLAEDALAELARLGHLVAHPADDATRYGMPEDGWTYARTALEGGAAADAPEERSLAALESGAIGGYPMVAPIRSNRGATA